jgi:peptidyl-prolyl cis-trans isomerase C
VKTRLDYSQTEYLAREFFRRQLEKTPQITEEELQAFYKEHVNEFKPSEEIQARHILVPTEAQANKILDELKSGKDFAELAKKYSIDPAATKGGKFELPDGRDWLPKGTFEKSFEFSLFKIPKGQVAGPIKSQFGWHLLKVDDRRQPETPAFVQVRGMIKNRLMDQKTAQIHTQVTEQAKKEVPVEIK